MGIKIKTNFKSVDNILNDIKKEIEKNPEIFTDQNKGKEIEGSCPICNEKVKMTILLGGKCRCNKCNNDFKLDMNVK